MSLTQGVHAHHPCPVCLAPKEQLSDLFGTWPLRDAVQTQALLQSARALDNTQRENLLSQNGLRDIDVGSVD
jgi:hypothetical protein